MDNKPTDTDFIESLIKADINFLELMIKAQDESNEQTLVITDKYLKLLLGNNLYCEYRAKVVREEMKEIIEDNMNPEFDVYETPDNKALESAAAYRILKYFSVHEEYKAYVEGLRDEQGDE